MILELLNGYRLFRTVVPVKAHEHFRIGCSKAYPVIRLGHWTLAKLA
jgi:hypothetical protein